MTIVKWHNKMVEKFEDNTEIFVNRGEHKLAKDLKVGDCYFGLIIVAVKHK